MSSPPSPRMIAPTQLVLKALMGEPSYMLSEGQICTATHMRIRAIRPSLVRLQSLGWLECGWEDSVAARPNRQGQRFRDRYYQLTKDGVEAARVALARASATRQDRHQSVTSGQKRSRTKTAKQDTLINVLEEAFSSADFLNLIFASYGINDNYRDIDIDFARARDRLRAISRDLELAANLVLSRGLDSVILTSEIGRARTLATELVPHLRSVHPDEYRSLPVPTFRLASIIASALEQVYEATDHDDNT